MNVDNVRDSGASLDIRTMRDGLSIARESTSARRKFPAGDESILKEPVLWVLTIYHKLAGSDKVRRKGVG